MYTTRKVYLPLAQKLGDGRPSSAHFVRWSVGKDTGGSAGQRASHFSIYDTNPDIAAISAIPLDAWDPARPEVGSQHGITWITMSDLHHGATGHEPIAAVVSVGDVVFLSITMSSTTKHIERLDAEDLNGTTALVMSVLNHFPTLRRACWADDVTRANRDNADWAAIADKCRVRDMVMVFGGQSYDQNDPGQRLALGVLGLTGSNDDPMRRRRLSGKTLMKYKRGGAAISEQQMPHGWRHQRNDDGEVVREGERGLVPEAEPAMAPVLAALYAGHASGETYQVLAQRLIDFEAAGQLKRRDHTNRKNTYAASAHTSMGRYDAAKSFFIRNGSTPAEPPSEAAVARYLAGEDPQDVFDIDVLMYIAKVELVRTGRYYRRRANDIRGRGIVLDGIPAVYRDDRDEYGWFDVHSAPWPWPVTETGAVLERFGIPDQTCRKVAVRLLHELRAPKSPTGGRAHHVATRRALQGFQDWTVPTDDPSSRYEDEPTQWGIEARANNSGKANFIVLFRRESDGQGPRGRRGWSYVGDDANRPDHIAATGSLAELCASVAHHLDRGIRRLLNPADLAVLRTVPEPVIHHDPSPAWRGRIATAEAEISELELQAKGLRSMAARMLAADSEAEANSYADQAIATAGEIATLRREIERLTAKIAHRDQGVAETQTRNGHADLSIAAYVVAGLERAALDNGSGPLRLGQLCDTYLRDWRFDARGGELRWTANAVLPLINGEEAELPLTGVIGNVRTRQGKATATRDLVARYVLGEGRDMDRVADLLQVTRKTLLTQRVMPWLVENGITSRGAKNALVDHPDPDVRRAIYTHFTGDRATNQAATSPYVDLLRQVYLDPDLQWGDACVPDDTTWIQDALDLLARTADAQTTGMRVLDLALALGRTEEHIRQLVTPPSRSAGFTRPRFLRYLDPLKTTVAVIACPHRSCRDKRSADHVALLPEVAASGYGVICRHCRRAPAAQNAWPTIQFPASYLTRWTNAGTNSTLRRARQTVTSPGHPHPGEAA